MGIYYHLIDLTQQKRIHYDCCVKVGPICYNNAVQMAMINYMFDHPKSLFQFVSDGDGSDIYENYDEVDLKNISFESDINKKIKNLYEQSNRVRRRSKIMVFCIRYFYKIKYFFSDWNINRLKNKFMPYRIYKERFLQIEELYNKLMINKSKEHESETALFIQLRNENEQIKKMLKGKS